MPLEADGSVGELIFSGSAPCTLSKRDSQLSSSSTSASVYAVLAAVSVSLPDAFARTRPFLFFMASGQNDDGDDDTQMSEKHSRAFGMKRRDQFKTKPKSAFWPVAQRSLVSRAKAVDDTGVVWMSAPSTTRQMLDAIVQSMTGSDWMSPQWECVAH